MSSVFKVFTLDFKKKNVQFNLPRRFTCYDIAILFLLTYLLDILAEPPELKPSPIDVGFNNFLVALAGISVFFKVSNILRDQVWLHYRIYKKTKNCRLPGFGEHHSNILTAQFRYGRPGSVLLRRFRRVQKLFGAQPMLV